MRKVRSEGPGYQATLDQYDQKNVRERERGGDENIKGSKSM